MVSRKKYKVSTGTVHALVSIQNNIILQEILFIFIFYIYFIISFQAACLRYEILNIICQKMYKKSMGGGGVKIYFLFASCL